MTPEAPANILADAVATVVERNPGPRGEVLREKFGMVGTGIERLMVAQEPEELLAAMLKFARDRQRVWRNQAAEYPRFADDDDVVEQRGHWTAWVEALEAAEGQK